MKHKNKNKDKYLNIVRKMKVFLRNNAVEAGIPASSVTWLSKLGEIISIGPGVYREKNYEIDPEVEQFIVACQVFGEHSVIAGPSALSYYNLIEQIPQQIWLLVPAEKTTHNKNYRLIRTKLDLISGIKKHEWYRITTIERSIVDAFIYSSKIGGHKMAIAAARKAIKENQVDARNLLKIATKLNKKNVILNQWEAITLE